MASQSNFWVRRIRKSTGFLTLFINILRLFVAYATPDTGLCLDRSACVILY